jgi:hypothetical protein
MRAVDWDGRKMLKSLRTSWAWISAPSLRLPFLTFALSRLCSVGVEPQEKDRGIADRCLSRGRYPIAWCSNPAEPKVELHRERVGTVGEDDLAGDRTVTWRK